MRAFIIRPFGKKQARSGLIIDFDEVQRVLIDPALDSVGLEGRTTIEIIGQGNIREDMFQRLLTADVVVADITIHNANVFYELGLRHALRERITFLLRGVTDDGSPTTDDVPFDLKTDRYLAYRVTDPAGSLDKLRAGLEASRRDEKADSPAFQLLPAMVAQDPVEFLVAPREFREAVRLRRKEGRIADLALMSLELARFKPEWGQLGQRLVGEALFRCKAFEAAVEAWERVRAFNKLNVQANLRLATCFQKLDDLNRSDLALERLDEVDDLDRGRQAERLALMGSNAKERWIQEWREQPLAEARRRALESAYLQASVDYYRRAFDQDLNHFYSGFNALALSAVRRELAQALPEIWTGLHESDEKADTALTELVGSCTALQATVEMSIRAELARTAAEPDPWTVITDADFTLLTSSRAGFVVRKYREALVGATRQMCDSILRQIRVYTALELFGEVAKEAAAAVDGLAPPTAKAPATDRCLIFTGHRADMQGRAEPRFPNTKAAISKARRMIHAAVEEEQRRTDGRLVGVAGGASGGDLLFHEVCGELGIKTWLLLAVPRDLYVRASVQDGGPDWVDRFDTLYRDRQAADRLLVLQNEQTLPSWLADAPDYSVWLRNNLWTFWFGLCNGAQNASLIALWNGKEGDSFGGTKDMVQLAEDHGTRTKILPAEQLLRAKN